MFIDDNAIGIAAKGDAPKVFIGRIESESHVRAELLEVTFAIRASAVGVDHATNRDDIAWLVLSSGRTDLGYTANDLVTRNDRVIRRHELAPFVANRVKVGVANATKKNLDLHVAVRWIAPRNCCRGQQRCLSGSRISFRFVSAWMHT